MVLVPESRRWLEARVGHLSRFGRTGNGGGPEISTENQSGSATSPRQLDATSKYFLTLRQEWLYGSHRDISVEGTCIGTKP